MWRRLLVAAVILLAFNFIKAQKIYRTNYASDADIKVYVSKHSDNADLRVYKTVSKVHSKGNRGRWFFVNYKISADKKIYFTNYKNEADLVICYTGELNDAGWQNSSKRRSMD